MEYEVLREVRRIGVNAPEPIAYAYKGRIFYKAWLVTREIVQPQTLAELSFLDEQHACLVMKEVIAQVAALMNHSILHVDLHPGNVVVDSSGHVFLLDFDKAYFSRKKQKKLCDYYLSRWRRAIMKHHLPEILSEMMDTGLQKTN
jgi:3-deoxy-D-manno-octulosonic acid kinase